MYWMVDYYHNISTFYDIIYVSLRKSAEAIGPLTLTGNLKFVKVPQNHTRLYLYEANELNFGSLRMGRFFFGKIFSFINF